MNSPEWLYHPKCGASISRSKKVALVIVISQPPGRSGFLQKILIQSGMHHCCSHPTGQILVICPYLIKGRLEKGVSSKAAMCPADTFMGGQRFYYYRKKWKIDAAKLLAIHTPRYPVSSLRGNTFVHLQKAGGP